MTWQDILKADLESKILSEIEKEGGALGMKNLKQFGEEAEIKQALSKLRKEGKIFMHEDGDIYTHKPEDIEKISYAQNMQLWERKGNNRQQPKNNIEGKSYRMNQEQQQFYNKQKQELKQYNPNADKQALHRMALRRTLKQYPNLQEV